MGVKALKPRSVRAAWRVANDGSMGVIYKVLLHSTPYGSALNIVKIGGR